MFRFPYLGFPYGYPYYNYSNKYYYNKNIEKKEEKRYNYMQKENGTEIKNRQNI